MPDEDLAALVARAREDLPHRLRSFEELAGRQYAPLRSLAWAIVRDDDLASGIAQDALMRIMHGLPKLADVDKYPAWSRRITVNVARSRLAKERREREKRAAFAAETEWFSAAEGDAASFADLIASLSVDERTIVSLKILDDLEFNEIAEVAGIGVSAAKMRYYRALEKLKTRVLDDDAEPP